MGVETTITSENLLHPSDPEYLSFAEYLYLAQEGTGVYTRVLGVRSLVSDLSMPVQEGLLSLSRAILSYPLGENLYTLSIPGRNPRAKLAIATDGRGQPSFAQAQFTLLREGNMLKLSSYHQEIGAILGMTYEAEATKARLLYLGVSLPSSSLPKRKGADLPLTPLLSSSHKLFPPRILVSPRMKETTRRESGEVHSDLLEVYRYTSKRDNWFGGGENVQRDGFCAERDEDTVSVTLPGYKKAMQIPYHLREQGV